MFRKTILLFLFLLLIGKSLFATDNLTCKLWVDSVFSTLSADERIGQLFIYNSPSEINAKNVKALLSAIKEQYIGGILFWKGNINDQAELTNFAQATSKVPLMITMDGEWGLSMRLKNGLMFPKKTTLSALTDEQLIYDFGVDIGRQCNELRINVNLDPVLDVNINPENPVINTRSFGDNPEDVSRKASLFVKGLNSKGVMAVGKHFPGHGDTSQDSHEELAIVTHDSAQFYNVDIAPFKELINKGMQGIMVGHISVPAIDTTGYPASLSPILINDILKKQLNFEGLIFTDAMKMNGVTKNENAAVRALLAGNDILLDPLYIKKEFEAIKKAVKDSLICMDLIDEKCKKILKYKYLYGINNFQAIKIEGLEARINTPEAILLQQKMVKQSITLLKNNNDILPIKDLAIQHIAIISVGASNQTQFIQTAGLYTKTSNYTLSETDPVDSILNLMCKVDSADLIILAIHSSQIPDSLIALAAGNKKTIFVSFRSPYLLKDYPLSIEHAEAVVLGYENLQMMQDACAQALFGGVAFKGKLPINSQGIAARGDGFLTQKMRLEYDTPESVGLNSSILHQIDSIAEDGIAKEAMPGCQILVAKKGKIVYRKSFGFHDYSKQTPVKNSDIYDIASLTKISVTLPLIMKLFDEEKIDLDKKISSYLPELKHSNKKNITIYELLTHQAGLKPFIPFYQQAIDMESVEGKLMKTKKDENYSLQVDKNYYANKNYKFKPGFISSVWDSAHSLQIADSMYIINSFKDSIWEQIIESPVSKKEEYVYSDLSFLILQKIIERITNKSLDELIAYYFYNDLGADKTGYFPLQRVEKNSVVPTEVDSFLRKQLIKGFVHDQNAAFMGGIAGHAGNFSNCNDLAKLYQMILNGGMYGGKEYLTPETCSFFTTYKSDISRRGLGFDRSETNGRIMYGHTGFTGTCLWFDPKEELICIFLSNRIHPASWNKKLIQMNIRTNIEEVIYQSIINKKPLE